MHGELMEFNSHLQVRLALMENYAKRLRTELVHLRGPLPSDYDAVEYDNRPHGNSVSSENPLIHIWIPSTFLVQGTNPHHVYQIYIRIGDNEWTIFKRYSQMYKFRKEMKERYGFMSTKSTMTGVVEFRTLFWKSSWSWTLKDCLFGALAVERGFRNTLLNCLTRFNFVTRCIFVNNVRVT